MADVELQYLTSSQFTWAHAVKAVKDGSTVGSVMITEKRDGSIHLSCFSVDEKFRNQGIGRKILQFVKGKHKGKKITLDTNKNYQAAYHLYLSEGFNNIKEIGNHVKMEFEANE